MSQSKKLIRRQTAVVEDLFAGELGEQEVLQKHGVSPSLFERWVARMAFSGNAAPVKISGLSIFVVTEDRFIVAECAIESFHSVPIDGRHLRRQEPG